MDYAKNYVLTDEQVQYLISNKIINPFVPKGDDGKTPIYVLKKEDLTLFGEGGLGSGKKLKLSEAEKKERRKEQLKNAQRVYRQNNRDIYNKKQNEYYYDMKKNDAKYSNWKDKMLVVNQNYRAKRKLQTGQKKIIKDIEKQLKKEWKEKPENKRKQGRPKKGEEKKKKEIDTLWFETEKQKRIQAELSKLGTEYVIPKEPYKYTEKDVETAKKFGISGVKVGEYKKDTDGRQVYKKYESDLKKDPVYPYIGDVGKGDDMPYTESDYIEYKATKLIPKPLKKEIKKEKKQKENIELVIQEKPKKVMTKENKEIKILEEYQKETNSQANIKSSNVRNLMLEGKLFNEWYKKKYGEEYK